MVMGSRSIVLRPQVQCFDNLIANNIDDLDFEVDASSIHDNFKNLKQTTLKFGQLRIASSSDNNSSSSGDLSNNSVKRSNNKTDFWPVTKKKRREDEEGSRQNSIDFPGSPWHAKHLSTNRVELSSVGSSRCNTPICLLDDSTLEEGEIRELNNTSTCIFSESLPYERPKRDIEHKCVKSSSCEGSYNLANSSSPHFRMPARFDRYRHSKFHKYVTIVLDCPKGCKDVVFEKKVDLDKHLLEMHGISSTPWCVNNVSDVPW